MTVASMLLASLSSGVAFAEDTEKNFVVRMSMDSKIKIPTWDVINSIYGSWSNVGSPHSCNEWAAPTGTVTMGEEFQQSRVCQQSQSRTVTTVLQNKVLKTTKNGDTSTVQRDVSVTEFRNAVGTGDYIVSERLADFNSWARDSGNYGCGEWTPSADLEPLYEPFIQSRTCSKDEVRTRDVFHVWSSGKETFKRTDTEEQTVSVIEQQEAVGEQDYIYLMSPDPWSEWQNVSFPYECSNWGPFAADVDIGTTFEQTRACLQMQKATRDIYFVFRSGIDFFYETEEKTRNTYAAQTRLVEGERDFIVSENTSSWSAWADAGTIYSCSDWDVTPDEVNLNTSFTQSRQCSQDQSRTRTVENVWASGKTTFNRTESDGQTVLVADSQQSTGTKNYNTGEVEYGAWTSWSADGAAYNCGSPSPLANTVNLGQSFTQESSCKQDQVRTRVIYDVYANGTKLETGVDSDSATITTIQRNTVVGTKDYIVSTSNGEWSSWVNTGGLYSCGAYSPDASTVDYGTSFTQSRSCQQDQSRTRTIFNNWKSGVTTTKTTESDSQSVSVPQSQQATGVKNVVVSSESTTGAWYYTASGSCGDWSPATSTVNYGTSFTQTQSCSRPRARTITNYSVLSDGSKVVKSTSTESGTYYYSNSVPATGTKDYILNSGWDNNYSVTTKDWVCGAYGPSPITVQDGVKFTQTRECTQTVETNKRYFDTWKVEGRVYTGSIGVYSTSTNSKVESRDSWGAGVDCPYINPNTGIWTYCD